MVAIILIASVSVFAQDNGTSAEWKEFYSKKKGYKDISGTDNTVSTDVVGIQNNKVFTIDSLYQNKEEFVILNKILEFPGKTKTDIRNGFKNWASTNFVNLKEIMVSETEDQIVLNYITKQMYVKALGSISPLSWYVRVVTEFKDGKMRVKFIDDGNSFWVGDRYAPSTPARTIFLNQYFKEGEPIKRFKEGMINHKNIIVTVANSIKIDEQKKKEDNW